MSMTGGYLSMAEAVGEREHARGWVPGVDFDPYDEDEMDVMRLVWERERYDRVAELERENAMLRGLVEPGWDEL